MIDLVVGQIAAALGAIAGQAAMFAGADATTRR